MPKPPEIKNDDNRYNNKAIRFIDKQDHYELVFTDNFDVPTEGSLGGPAYTTITDVIMDLKEADKSKELHIFVGSYGGAVHSLNMLIQHITQFKYVVGINLGYACSCGFMLLAYCNEIYTTPYATFLYHDMSSLMFGKITELKNVTKWQEKWWSILVDGSHIDELLTPEEIKLGETSEVWLTGQDLLDRHVVNHYDLYIKRSILKPVNDEFYIIGNEIYRKEGNVFQRYIKDKSSKRNNLNYHQLVCENTKFNINN